MHRVSISEQFCYHYTRKPCVGGSLHAIITGLCKSRCKARSAQRLLHSPVIITHKNDRTILFPEAQRGLTYFFVRPPNEKARMDATTRENAKNLASVSPAAPPPPPPAGADRKSTRLNSSHMSISYAVFCL